MPLSQVRTFFAVGSDARLAAKHAGRSLKNPAFSVISRKALAQFMAEIKPLSIEEMVSRYDIAYAEAETLLPALMAYQEILLATQAKEMTVASVSMRDGLLIELSRRCTGVHDNTLDQELIQSALSIAEKYKVNLHHAKRVAICAVRLFDQLAPEHQLGQRQRVLLEVAALLHEIGTFVSTRAYHKHTYYLIANSQLYGLNRDENLIVANVARYHRRSAPKSSHAEYMTLPKDHRVAVNKLASLLRLAKALDVSDVRDIDKLQCSLAADTLLIKVPGLSQTSLRKRSLEIRSDFFEDVYGLKLEFQQA
jgi:exopolyphosphatase/guanosine-5'-triphosphate,3'-diphosphate pyrophosphatase